MAEYVLNSTYNPWLDPQHQKQRNKNQSKQDYKQQTKPKPKLTTAVSSSLTWHQDRQDSDGSLGGGGGAWSCQGLYKPTLSGNHSGIWEVSGIAKLFYP